LSEGGRGREKKKKKKERGGDQLTFSRSDYGFHQSVDMKEGKGKGESKEKKAHGFRMVPDLQTLEEFRRKGGRKKKSKREKGGGKIYVSR